jgi:hypothetical protein
VRAVCLFHVLIESQAGSRPCDHAGKRGLAHLQRVTRQVIAVVFDQVEGIEEYIGVMVPVSDAVEIRHSVVTTGNRLAIDDAGPCAQPCDCLDNEREAIGQVIAWPAVELDPLADFASDNPESVMLDLV